MNVEYYTSKGISKLSVLSMMKLLVFTIIYSPLYYILVWWHYFLARSCKHNYKYEVSLCLIFKNEAKYLKEWLDYHILIGVDHFYLYNNNSDDGYADVLAPYIEKKIVTLVDFPFKYAQLKAYNDCYEQNKKETHWLGYIDADEFVNIRDCNNIKSFLMKYGKFPAVTFNWRMFGTSGHIFRPDKMVIEAYTSCWPCLTSTGKTFINNDYDFNEISVHWHTAKFCGIKLFPVNLSKIISIHNKSLINSAVASKGYLNHYWSKSLSEYVYKDYVKGDVASKELEKRKTEGNRFLSHELNNSDKDYSIQRWLTPLKREIENLSNEAIINKLKKREK